MSSQRLSHLIKVMDWIFQVCKGKLSQESKLCVRVKLGESTEDLDDYFKECDYSMIELDSKVIHDEKIVKRSKDNGCEPIYLALILH